MNNINVWEDAEPGVKRRILGAQGALMVMEVHFEAGAEGYVHQHPHEQMDYCVAGRFEFSIDDKVTFLEAGQTIYIPGNARHGAKALKAGVLLDIFTPVRQDLLKT